LENEKDFITSLETASNIIDALHAVADILNFTGKTAALEVTSASISALSSIIEGIRIFKLGVGQFTAFNTRAVLQDYIDGRKNGLTKGIVWQDIQQTYGDIILPQISDRTDVPISMLDDWFENAFTAYRLVGYADSASIRYAQGAAIADLAVQAWQMLQ
jgi:hypothetical protein